MFITRMSLPRRTFLRGMGATIALPLLDSMVPALSALAKTAAAPAPRVAFFYASNGMYMPHWVPTGVGTTFEMSKILAPLAPPPVEAEHQPERNLQLQIREAAVDDNERVLRNLLREVRHPLQRTHEIAGAPGDECRR